MGRKNRVCAGERVKQFIFMGGFDGGVGFLCARLFSYGCKNLADWKEVCVGEPTVSLAQDFNPWMSMGDEEVLSVVEDDTDRKVTPIPVVAGVRQSDDTVLPIASQMRDFEGLIVVGAHGGAGTTTLACLTGLIDGGHVWTRPSGSFPNGVLFACRSTVSGLDAALSLARVAASGAMNTVQVWGLVVMADIPEKPKKTPPEILSRIELCKGVFPWVGRVGWIDGLRTHSQARWGKETDKVLDRIRQMNNQRKEQYAHRSPVKFESSSH